ncbi:hypothetical protein HN51_005347, partial [Arachis hypogaea]
RRGCRWEEVDSELRKNAGRDVEEGSAESTGGKSLRWRRTEGAGTMALAGYARGMGETAGDRKAAREASAVMTGAGRFENWAERVEGAATPLEEIHGAKDVDGDTHDAYHQAIGDGHAVSMKEDLGIALDNARNSPVQSVDEGN